jgi:Protein of unknown function (DUF3307)
MEQLLLHAIGDYITQTDWMAREKLRRWSVAWVHALVYALPFGLLAPSWPAWLVIFGSHALIDRYALARHLIYWRARIFDPSLRWADCQETGFGPQMPPWKAFWLMVLTDNVMHLCINYAALRWL